MNVGIIGYGSMGRMLLERFAESGQVDKDSLFVTNRTLDKIVVAPDKYIILATNAEVAKASDILFICVRFGDVKTVLEDIKESVKEDALVVSLNGSIPFELMEKVADCKYAIVIPSLTAEINRSETLVSFQKTVDDAAKTALKDLLSVIGNVIEIPESEIAICSELVSCMPGFIASMFDVICERATKFSALSKEHIVGMVLGTMHATGELMIKNDMPFDEVVSRVATKGGITEVGSKVIYEDFPATADKMLFESLKKSESMSETAKDVFKD